MYPAYFQRYIHVSEIRAYRVRVAVLREFDDPCTPSPSASMTPEYVDFHLMSGLMMPTSGLSCPFPAVHRKRADSRRLCSPLNCRIPPPPAIALDHFHVQLILSPGWFDDCQLSGCILPQCEIPCQRRLYARDAAGLSRFTCQRTFSTTQRYSGTISSGRTRFTLFILYPEIAPFILWGYIRLEICSKPVACTHAPSNIPLLRGSR